LSVSDPVGIDELENDTVVKRDNLHHEKEELENLSIMKMKVGFYLGIVAVAIFTTSHLWAGDSPIGKWRTIDTKTGQDKEIMDVYEQDGKIYVKIGQFIRTEDKGKFCNSCVGDDFGKPLEGMVIVKDLKPDGDKYSGGTIFNPDNGATQSCDMKVEDGGRKLVIESCNVFLCVRWTWHKLK